MRSGSTLTVACQVSVRLRPRRPCGSASRCSIATNSPGESASTSSSGSPILLRPVGMGCGPSSRRTRTCLRFASSVTSAATRSPRAAQAQRLIADGSKLLLNCPFFSQTRSYGTTAGNRRWNRACHVASLRRPAIVSLSCRRGQASISAGCGPSTFPGSRKPVTNQGKDGPLRGAMPGMKLGAGRGLRLVCRGFAGWGWAEGACWVWRAVRRHRFTLDRSRP